MSMTEKKLNDLFLTTLKDVYYAEKAILRALPKMAKGGPVWRPPQTRKLIP
jgi:ferritin-like metal-binding protein YciE